MIVHTTASSPNHSYLIRYSLDSDSRFAIRYNIRIGFARGYTSPIHGFVNPMFLDPDASVGFASKGAKEDPRSIKQREDRNREDVLVGPAQTSPLPAPSFSPDRAPLCPKAAAAAASQLAPLAPLLLALLYRKTQPPPRFPSPGIPILLMLQVDGGEEPIIRM